MNRDLPSRKRGQFLLVIVHQNDLMAHVGETCAGYQTNISRPYDCNLHHVSAPGAQFGFSKMALLPTSYFTSIPRRRADCGSVSCWSSQKRETPLPCLLAIGVQNLCP